MVSYAQPNFDCNANDSTQYNHLHGKSFGALPVYYSTGLNRLWTKRIPTFGNGYFSLASSFAYRDEDSIDSERNAENDVFSSPWQPGGGPNMSHTDKLLEKETQDHDLLTQLLAKLMHK